jgi:hypothetical protein
VVSNLTVTCSVGITCPQLNIELDAALNGAPNLYCVAFSDPFMYSAYLGPTTQGGQLGAIMLWCPPSLPLPQAVVVACECNTTKTSSYLYTLGAGLLQGKYDASKVVFYGRAQGPTQCTGG